jgi:hypothetical protein
MKNYTLELDGLCLYLSAKQTLSSCNLTGNIKKAMVFNENDNEAYKVSIWTAQIQKVTNSKLTNFEAKAI